MSRPVRIHDFAPDAGNILEEVLAGLRARPKTLPPKLFYDERGSELFDMICRTPEYYPTRTESAIMREHAAAMASMIGPRAMVIEYGSGTADKTRILLDALEAPVAYVPIDISSEHLMESSAAIASDYAGLQVLPVCADYDQPVELPHPRELPARRIVYFPGSTIGNFHPEDAVRFMARMARRAGPRGAVLIGADLQKDPAVLNAAYNDAAGVTAAFNINILVRLNRELGADFDLDRFMHYAYYNETAGRIEMHLVSRATQTVTVGGEEIDFSRGESIWTESSYKYTLDGFAGLARRAGLDVARVWTDAANLFSVQYLTVG